ncbi:MAG: hypothetical protein H6Q91_2260 [Deltaproteobacteria bacterium]|nr:hypothetical protein [Deltaproteobacteria bacterium]
MNSVTTERFRRALQLFRSTSSVVRAAPTQPSSRTPINHPSLRFKPVHATRSIYSARVGLGYRALAVRDGGTWIWFWIGNHADYDRLLRDL